MMETVHKQGIWVAEGLQDRLMDYEGFWLFVTHMGDPKAAFLLCFPITYYLSRSTGVAVVWVAVISEWLNLVFKWMLFGERPFWWVGESGLFRLDQPRLRQFPSTCETGPGSPSGHAMVTSAVWFVMATALSTFLHARTRSVVLKAVPYLLYLAIVVAVAVSRLFILAHFPHQVVAGSLTGLTLGWALSWVVPEGRGLGFFVRVSGGLLLGALLLQWGLESCGVDLSWSIALARRWCAQAEWIRLDTTPLSSLMRDCGSLVGLGLAQWWRPGGWALPWAPRTLCVALSAMALYHINRLPLPTNPPSLFYCLFFAKFALVPCVVIALVPGLVHLLTGKRLKDK
ncbi:glucose-6-phosphatase 3 [Amia ocellicauda]|uniref:glucose-6-phosphatase 3 n=1 Tax=Amia ocellicauda TaxID=2972642 RepID=UPI003463A875